LPAGKEFIEFENRPGWLDRIPGIVKEKNYKSLTTLPFSFQIDPWNAEKAVLPIQSFSDRERGRDGFPGKFTPVSFRHPYPVGKSGNPRGKNRHFWEKKEMAGSNSTPQVTE
jgi:hypothetical protein